MTPSSGLWDKIDTQLTRQESGAYRQRFLFYRAAAAACLVCLLGLAMYTARRYDRGSDPASLATDDRLTVPPVAGTKPPTNQASAPPLAQQTPPAPQSKPSTLPSNPQDVLANQAREAYPYKAKVATKRPSGTAATYLARGTAAGDDQLAGLSPAASLGWQPLPASVVLPEREEPVYKVPNPFVPDAQESQAAGPVFFAGLDLSGNYFDPNFRAPAASASADAVVPSSLQRPNFTSFGSERVLYNVQTQAPETQSTPQASFSYGMDLGLHLTEHLSVESGMDYGRFNTATTTNVGIQDFIRSQRYPLTVANTYQLSAGQSVSYTGHVPLTSSFELLSVPLKVGYRLAMKKLQLFVSSGMAANFLLNNRISDASGQLSTVNVQAGPESIYRLVYYSGIISGGIHYNMVGNYLIKVAPEYSFSVSEMTRQDSFIRSQPSLFGVNFGVIYQFK